MSDVPNRLLRETLRDRLEPSSDCLDADVLAAWADGTLSRGDRTRVESHAASCARCQAMLAAMARTAAPPAARKWWQASTVRWLVPLATVSTLAVVVWMRAPSERLAAPAPRLTVDTISIPAPASAPEAPRADVAVPKSKAATSTSTTPRRAAQRTEPSGSIASAPPPASLEEAGPARFASPAPPPPPASPAPPPPPQGRVVLVAPAARSIAAPSAAENVVIVPPMPIADRQLARSELRSTIQSPNEDVRWRIVAGTVVERSTDGGIAWQTQSTGAVRLVAGSAPSATVCWLVGPSGVVLRSTDTRTWQRVMFPEAIDLTAILATDGLNATVTAADGRVFVTTDGGQTWRSP